MNHLGKDWDTIDDTILSFAEIVEVTNFEFAIDCTDANPEFHKTWRKFGLWCGEPIAFLISIPSCREAYKTAIKFVNDEVSLEVMKAAIPDIDPVQYLTALKYIQALSEMTKGSDNKLIIIPYEASGLANSVASIKKIFEEVK